MMTVDEVLKLVSDGEQIPTNVALDNFFLVAYECLNLRDEINGLTGSLDRAEKQRDELLEALNRILSIPPGKADGGGFVVDHFDCDGEYIGSQGVDPMWVVQEMASVANSAIAKAEG